MNSVMFLYQTVLFRLLTFLLGYLTLMLMVLLLWIYFSFLALVSVLQWCTLICEIAIKLLSQFPFICPLAQKTIVSFIARLLTIIVLTGIFLVIISEIGGYLFSMCFYYCFQILWLGSIWNWCIYTSSKGLNQIIPMVFNNSYCFHCS